MILFRHRKKKRLDRACTELCRSVLVAVRTKPHAIPAEQSYVGSIRRFIFFRDRRHSLEMGAGQIEAYLSCFTRILDRRDLAVRGPMD